MRVTGTYCEYVVFYSVVHSVAPRQQSYYCLVFVNKIGLL